MHAVTPPPCRTHLLAPALIRPSAIAGAPQHHAQQQSTSNGLKMLAVGLAAASLMHSAPADAGVILTKPQLKKVNACPYISALGLR